MGDFWHMALEETSFMGAFICAGDLLSHVHIAGLKQRIIPGVHPEADNYVDGFKGLKLIGCLPDYEAIVIDADGQIFYSSGLADPGSADAESALATPPAGRCAG